MTRTPDEAIDTIRSSIAARQTFTANQCKARCRTAYGVESDGSRDAAEAWTRTNHRLPWDEAPRGALLWWLGGSAHHGHVAIKEDEEVCWTVDNPQTGRWNLTPILEVAQRWPLLKLVGASLDIDGVQVVPTPAPLQGPAPEPGPSTTPLATAILALARNQNVSLVAVARAALALARDPRRNPDAGRRRRLTAAAVALKGMS